MNAHRHLPWALVAIAMVLSGCTVRAGGRVRYGASATVAVSAHAPQQIIVARPPPPLRAEAVVSAQPSPDAVWCPGHYEWSGRWVWVPGRWERNRAGYVWVAPVAHQRGGELVYHPGYWSPANRPPPPVYSQPGVAVSVVRIAPRPAPPPVVAARPAPPPVVEARPAPAPPPVVRPAPPPARPAPPPARPAPPPRNPPTVVVRPAPAPTPPPAVAVRPAPAPTPPPPSVTVRPAPAVRNPPTVVVRPPAPATPPTPVVTRPGRVTVTPAPANPTVVERRPTTGPVTPTVPGRVTVTPTPTPRQPSPPPTANVNPVPAPAVREPVRIRLTCRLDAPRAPMGGVVTLHGSGFQSSAQVIIGGTGAQIVSNRPNRIQVRVPGSSGGGQVRVVQGEESASCGSLSISSR